jgi:hypothetical protein
MLIYLSDIRQRDRETPMRVALAGVGHWHAAMHADAVRAAGATLAALWDPTPTIAATFAAREGGLAAASLPALLADAPDLVVVMGHPHDVPHTARSASPPPPSATPTANPSRTTPPPH